MWYLGYMLFITMFNVFVLFVYVKKYLKNIIKSFIE